MKPRGAPPPPPPAGNAPKPPLQNYVGARQVTSAHAHTHTHARVVGGADRLGFCCPGAEARPAPKGLRFETHNFSGIHLVEALSRFISEFLHVFNDDTVLHGFIYLMFVACDNVSGFSSAGVKY